MKRNHSKLSNSANTKICVSDYSVLLYDLSQRDSAIKSLKSELKSLKLSLRRKDKECQKLLSDSQNSHKLSSKKRIKRVNDCLNNSKNMNESNGLFEIRSSAVWSARMAHCDIQISEF